MKRVLIPLAQGVEEIEAVTLMDVLTRAGAQVFTASIDPQQEIHCSRGAKLLADSQLEDLQTEEFDLIALPGGGQGAAELATSMTLKAMLMEQKKAGRHYAALCASPALVLSPWGLLKDKAATGYPTFMDRLEAKEKHHQGNLTDGNCITGQGPAAAMGFALACVKALFGAKKRDEVAQGLLYPLDAFKKEAKPTPPTTNQPH